ncbi:24675_t:CDS:1, partial [Gigaspora rosea]
STSPYGRIECMAWKEEKEFVRGKGNAGIVSPSRRDDDTIEVIEEWIEEVVEKTLMINYSHN